MPFFSQASGAGTSSCGSSNASGKRSGGSDAGAAKTCSEPKRRKANAATLGAFGFTKTRTDSAGRKWSCDIPREAPVVVTQTVQCPWCDRTFATNSALGSHKTFAHPAANKAAQLVGTNSKGVGEGAVSLEVVNWTMLLIGKLEKELGAYAGAHTVDAEGRKIPVQPRAARSGRRGADRRVRHPVWHVQRAIDYHDWLKREGFPNPQQSATSPKAKLHVAHKFLTRAGWDVGRIVGKARGAWAVKYPTDRQQYIHDLNMTDYGVSGVWVVVAKG